MRKERVNPEKVNSVNGKHLVRRILKQGLRLQSNGLRLLIADYTCVGDDNEGSDGNTYSIARNPLLVFELVSEMCFLAS